MEMVEFCSNCGADAPVGARFCIECGMELRVTDESEPAIPAPATGVTVRLSNATVEQSVLGGTIKLASAEAIPPGMWTIDSPPQADDIVAVYVPLRAIVEGWSGLIDTGWVLSEQLPPLEGTTTPRFRFEATCTWFPAPGFGQGLRLQVLVRAEAEAQEGRTRRGFRYRSQYDPPMQVQGAWWINEQNQRLDRPVPRIQLMAPPRIIRISDVPETIRALPVTEAQTWAKIGKIHESLYLLHERQQRTPAGRGLILGIAQRGLLEWLLNKVGGSYYVQLKNPLICTQRDWQRIKRQIGKQAAELGMGMGTDATIEWWLDHQGYDGMVIDGVDPNRYQGYKKIVIAFRRSQIVRGD